MRDAKFITLYLCWDCLQWYARTVLRESHLISCHCWILYFLKSSCREGQVRRSLVFVLGLVSSLENILNAFCCRKYSTLKLCSNISFISINHGSPFALLTETYCIFAPHCVHFSDFSIIGCFAVSSLSGFRFQGFD